MMPHRVRVAALEHGDAEALLAMLGRCSPGSLYGRFHGVTNGTFYGRQVLAAAGSRDSYVAWRGQDCVGLGNLHLSNDTADIGVLVEDQWQRRGVGTALLIALVRRVRERGARFLRADVLDDNRFALHFLSLFGSAKTTLAAGSYTTLVDLEVGTTHSQTPSQITEALPSHPSHRPNGWKVDSQDGSRQLERRAC